MISAEELNRWDLPPVPGGEGLNHAPEDPVVIRTRLAALFGVPVECVTIAPSIGAAQIAPYEEFGELEPLYSPHQLGSAIWAERIGERPIIIIESQLEFLEGADRSYVAQAASEPGFFVIRTLEAYGISAGQMVAIIHVKEHRRAIRVGLRLERPSTPLQRAVETVLHPSRMRLIEQRIGGIRAERKRVATGLGIAVPFANFITLRSPDPIALARHGIRGNWFKDAQGQQTGDVEVPLGTPEENDRLLAAMGVPVPPRPPVRRAEVVRDTKETRIVATVDLDRAEPVAIATGIGFYDHMLEQVARHGGFACTLACEGDLHIEAHHTIEDSALALGEALRQALGDRRGVARFGFVAPLDEAEAAVTLDLSGRPFVKFEGAFARPMIGDYPTEMTSHVFRSLADAMRATIHVRVTGEDDHHKTEAAFKSFGRALRQAIRIEGDAVPSTKGVLG